MSRLYTKTLSKITEIFEIRNICHFTLYLIYKKNSILFCFRMEFFMLLLDSHRKIFLFDSACAVLDLDTNIIIGCICRLY